MEGCYNLKISVSDDSFGKNAFEYHCQSKLFVLRSSDTIFCSQTKVVLAEPAIHGETRRFTHFRNEQALNSHACLYEGNDQDQVHAAISEAVRAGANLFITSEAPLTRRVIPVLVIGQKEVSRLKGYCNENKHVTVRIQKQQQEQVVFQHQGSYADATRRGKAKTPSEIKEKVKDPGHHIQEKTMYMQIAYHSNETGKPYYYPLKHSFKEGVEVKVLLTDIETELSFSYETVKPIYDFARSSPVAFQNERDIEGKACVCTFSNLESINKVTSLSASKARILFVRSTPTVSIKLPTVVLHDIEIFEKLTPSYRKQHGVVYFSDTPFDDSFFENIKKDKKSEKEKVIAMESGKVIKLPKHKEEEEEGNFFTRGIVRGINLVRNTLGGEQTIAESKLKPLLEDRHYPLNCMSVEFYVGVVDIFSEMYHSKNETIELEVAMKIFQNYVQQRSFQPDIIFISLSFLLHNISKPFKVSTNSFIKAVFTAIENLDINNDPEPIKNYFVIRDGYPNPHLSLDMEISPLIPKNISNKCFTRILWLVFHHCGKRSFEFWSSLCAIMKPSSVEAESEDLSNFLPQEDILTLKLLSQKGLIEFCDVLTKHHERCYSKSETIHLHPEFEQTVTNIISNISVNNTENSPDLFVKLLDTFCLFDIKEDKLVKSNLLFRFLLHLSPSTHGNFDVLLQCFNRLSVTHGYHDLAKDCLLGCAHLKYKNNSFVPVGNTIALLSSSFGKTFAVNKHELFLRDYSERLYNRSGVSTKQKLDFYTCIFELFVGEDIAKNSENIAHAILHLIEGTVNKITSKLNQMTTLYDIAKDNPNFLFHDSNTISFDSVKYIIERLFGDFELDMKNKKSMGFMKKVLRDIDTSHPPQSFCSQIRDRIKASLLSRKPNEATFLFNELIHENMEPFLSLADSVITTSFNFWKPTSIADILELDSGALVGFVNCLQCQNDRNDRKLIELSGIVKDWVYSYHNGDITYKELSSIINTFQNEKNKWSVLKLLCDNHSEFPDGSNILDKLEEFEDTQRRIYASLSFRHTKNSVYDLLKNYEIKLEEYDDLSDVLLKYDNYFDKSNRKNLTSLDCEDITLDIMRVDASTLDSFCNTYADELVVVEYFFSAKSILFQNEIDEGRNLPTYFLSFMEKVRATVNKLKIMSSDDATFKMIQDARKVIKIEQGIVSEELDILRGCPNIVVPVDLEVAFDLVDGLVNIRTPLTHFTRFCEQFSFNVLKDSKFEELKVIAEELNKSLDDWSISTCTETHKSIAKLFDSEEQVVLQSSRNLFEVFTVLSSCNEVWKFAEERKWFGKDGLNNFYEEYRNVTNTRAGLGEDSYEMKVLDSFEPAIRYVSAVGELKLCENFNELLQSIQTNIDITKEVESGNKFAEITTSQTNILKIQEWFTEGMDDVAGILNKFNAIVESGTFSLYQNDSCKDSPDISLSLLYNVETEEQIMSSKAIDSFITNLGFIQHGNDDVRSFIDKYHVVSKVSRLILSMIAVGFTGVKISDFEYKTSSDLSTIQMDLRRYTEMKNECDSWLYDIRENYPMSLLFWMEELREMDGLLTQAKESEESRCLMLRMLSRIFLYNNTNGERLPQDSDAIFEPTLAMDSDDESEGSWLVRISQFIQKLYERFCGEGGAFQRLHPSSSQIIIHNIPSNSSTIQLIQYLYDKRLPRAFEVLDGFLPWTNENIYTFLQRAERFHSSIFTILNTQDLSSEHQEMIVEFLSKQDILSRNINIHFIQTRATLLYSSPWVKEKSWDDDDLSRDCTLSRFRDLVADSKFIDEVMVVYSKGSCSGKTRLIRNKMENISLQSEVSSINIHEGTTLSSLVYLLCKKFTHSSRARAIHFTFTFDIYQKEDPVTQKLLSMLNHFFISFLCLRSIYDPESKASFTVGEMKWKIFVELPCIPPGHVETQVNPKDWLSLNIPTLASCCILREPPDETFVDEHMRRVAIYLRAYEDGTIDRKFEKNSKRVVFVLDKSGSMQACVGVDANGTSKSCLDVAVDNTIRIFDGNVLINDHVSLVMFDHEFETTINLQQIQDDSHKDTLRQLIEQVRDDAIDGGTCMYTALNHVLSSLAQENDEDVGETWIVCLTDGASADSPGVLMRELQRSKDDVHIVIIGVNLSSRLHQPMADLSKKYKDESSPTKGFFLPTTAQVSAIDDAFTQVAASIPVSQTFELDGKLNDTECVDYIRKFMPQFAPKDDKLLQKFFVEFMYRRVKVFDENKDFNFNEKYERLGSSLMEIMLKEVEQFLVIEQNQDWQDSNHHQLIYDFSGGSPEFRLICTSPDQIEPEMRETLEALDLPGFRMPSHAELQKTQTLYKYLSQAMNLPIDILENQIKSNKYVLTLDFCLKLLNIHERIVCRIPCIIEGETGCSKTALTSMYSKLINSSLDYKAKKSTHEDLCNMEENLKDNHLSNEEYDDNDQNVEERIRNLMQQSDQIPEVLHELLTQACNEREPIFSNPPEQFLDTSNLSMESVSNFLTWFSECKLEPTFFEIDVHAALTEEDVSSFFEKVQAIARKLLHTDALIIVFLDEVNTSSIMGLFKEVVIDRSICGDRLEENIVVVAACNPPRTRALTQGGVFRENDLGKDWASGHYQVNRLPQSICNLKWNFGSLNGKKEKEFVYRRMEIIGEEMSAFTKRSLTELISASQEAIRSFAREHIYERLLRLNPHDESNAEEALLRSRSVVSLRDIQRVFSLFQFFLNLSLTVSKTTENNRRVRHSMLLTIGVVYYLRLSSESRKDFLKIIRSLPTERHEKESLLDVLESAMDKVVKMSEIPSGIALTRGFKENIFMTLVCSLSRTPLMIIGPPGCSKTLSVNTVTDNAKGQESMKEFYRELPRLQAFHYQCSKASTSTEVESIFKLAIQRQEKADPKKQLCMIFMDEAGLPEEEKESLKVLHYYLTDAKVGFVGISNHVLDAAKSNRCVTLLRPEPDAEELSCISKGVMFDFTEQECNQQHVLVDEKFFSADEFSMILCCAYSDLMQVEWFQTFYGLRDFIYFLKCVKRTSTIRGRRMSTTSKILLEALERNFSGIDENSFVKLVHRFLKDISGEVLENQNSIRHMCRHPMSVVEEALTLTQQSEGLSQERYKLIIDQTDDDSIMRLLSLSGCLTISQSENFKLSQMPENSDLEKLSLVSGVKFAALQGNFVVLSQTESINESFYDLFNQHFRTIRNHEGNVSYYANIAVGSLSRPSLIHNNFRCVVHIRHSDLDQTPIPFLNRFEKYTLSVSGVLGHCLRGLGGLSKIVDSSIHSLLMLKIQLGDKGICGWRENQTLESIFVHIFSDQVQRMRSTSTSENTKNNLCICGHLLDFSTQFTAMNLTLNDIESVIAMGIKYLPHEYSDILQQLCDSGEDIDHARVRDTLFSVVLSPNDSSSLETVVRIILQMIFTRYATISFLLKVSCPETIFQNRNNLPEEITKEYFNDNHFNLKQHLHQVLDDEASGHHIIYTRTDSLVRSLPSWSNKSGTDGDRQKSEKIKELIHDKPETVIVEHLCMLRSETALRSAIDSWLDDDSKSFFCLIIDMNEPNSISMTNFVRSFIDNITSSNKSMVLLLHFSPSSNCSYPTLFLGNWSYFFLDGVGSDSSLNVKPWIRAACSVREENDVVDDITSSLHVMLPRCLFNLASQNVLKKKHFPLKDRYESSKELMKFELGCESIENLLCRKFRSLCTNGILQDIFNKSSNELVIGTSQLSISTSVSSIIQDTFTNFLMFHTKELTSSFTSDILLESKFGSCAKTKQLSTLILENLPIPPFQELMLHRRSSSQTQLLLSPRVEDIDASSAIFPFFHFISSFLDESIEKVDAELQGSNNDNSEISLERVSVKEVFKMLSNTNTEGEISRKEVTELVVNFVQESDYDKEDSLFTRYLKQYLYWKLGCKSLSIILPWMMDKLEDIWNLDAGLKGNILCIHVVVRDNKMDLIQLSSWTHANSFHIVESILSKEGDISQICSHEISGKVNLRIIIENFAKTFASEEEHSDFTKNFADLLQRIPGIIESKRLSDESMLGQMRILGFQYILRKTKATERMIELTLDRFYNIEKNRINEKVRQIPRESSLNLFMNIIESHDDHNWVREAKFQLFKLFFSPDWLRCTSNHEYGDLDFLCSFIKSTGSSQHDLKRIATVSLRNFCMYSENSIETQTSISMSHFLQPIGDVVKSYANGVEISRKNLVPKWMWSDSEHIANEEYMIIDDALLQIVFEIILCQLAEDIEVQSLTSEDIFLMMESETNELDVNTHVLQKMVVIATTICFVTKVSQELSCKNNAEILTGVYGEEGSRVLKHLFSSESSWLVLLFSTMLRLKGEGYVYSNIESCEALISLGSIDDWLRGIPTNTDGLIQALQKANQDLQEATDDEMRKAGEFRLCPHCNRAFGVAAMNCGQFTCGYLDAHTPNNRNLGCGRPFTYNQTIPYAINQEKLTELTNIVQEMTDKLNQNEEHSQLWSKAKSLKVPILLLNAKKYGESEPFLPSANLSHHIETSRSQHALALSQNESCEFLKDIIDNMAHIEHFKGLECMIEFYLWLHLNLKFLLSREQAYQYKMGDLMKKETLEKRFDESHVHHIKELWRNVCSSVSTFLKEQNHVVYWDCEEVNVPFSSLEDAGLIMLLSEGNHPTEGNDFLFLIMNNIAEKYNSFVRKLNEYSAIEAEEIHPKLLVDCRRGNLLNLFNIDLTSTVQHLSECFWLPDKHTYDFESLANELRSEIGTTLIIRNMTSTLREQFRFRNSLLTDRNRDDVNGNNTSIAFKSSTGDFFVRRHDLELFESTKQSMLDYGIDTGNPSIRKTLHVHFHHFGYDSLRHMLEGIRNVFDLLVSHERSSITAVFDSFEEAINQASGTKTDKSTLIMMGFPSYSESQQEMLMKLTPHDIFEMILYVGKQLARESYVFQEYPARFKDDLGQKSSSELKRSIVKEMQRRGEDQVASDLDEFVNDLKFYERYLLSPQGQNAALHQDVTMTSLRHYLKENNCCDESDPIFNILPGDISISNYVGLRLELYQLRLFVLSHRSMHNRDDKDEKHITTKESFYSKPVRGSCWLWSSDQDISTDKDDTETVHGTEFLTRKLWFEETQIQHEIHQDYMSDICDTLPTPVHTNKDAENSEEKIEQNVELRNSLAANNIQRWWRSLAVKDKKTSRLAFSIRKSDYMKRHPKKQISVPALVVSEEISVPVLVVPEENKAMSKKTNQSLLSSILNYRFSILVFILFCFNGFYFSISMKNPMFFMNYTRTKDQGQQMDFESGSYDEDWFNEQLENEEEL